MGKMTGILPTLSSLPSQDGEAGLHRGRYRDRDIAAVLSSLVQSPTNNFGLVLRSDHGKEGEGVSEKQLVDDCVWSGSKRDG